MDETPHASADDSKRRRLLFRANHRGTRENDILVLEAIMDLPDPTLADWLTGRAPIPPEHDSPLLRAMREARGK
jgi:antitoxin CptB